MSDRSLPKQLVSEIDSPIREDRLRGVHELTRLVIGADLAVAAAARRALERMTGDDSRSVGAAAAGVLEQTSVRVNPDVVDFGRVPPGSGPLVAEVSVDGPPLALAASVVAAGPGLTASLDGRRLRLAWDPQTEWLHGWVTVRGLAGWADVRVTGCVVRENLSLSDVEEWYAGDSTGARLTILATPPRRRRRTGIAIVAGVAALVVLGGAGAAVAMLNDSPPKPPVIAQRTDPPTPTTKPTTKAAPLAKTPLALETGSLDKPTITGTIKVGNEPEGMAVSPDGKTVYVANQGSRILSIVDVASQKVARVRLHSAPRFVTVSRDGKSVFVSMYNEDKSGSGVAVVDAEKRRVAKYVESGQQPYTLAVAPDGRLWVPIHSRGRVEVFTEKGQRADGRVAVPPNPHAVAFAGGKVFTANHESNSVSIIDGKSGKLLKSVPVSKAPHSVATSPDGKRVLVAGFEAGTADLIDAASGKRTGPFEVGDQPQSVAFARDGRHAYVVNEGDRSVSVLDGKTGRTTATLRVGRSPRAIVVAPDGTTAYVSNGDDDTISVLRI